MALVDVTITNYGDSELTLPQSLNEQTIASGGTSKTFTMDPARVVQSTLNNKPEALADIKDMVEASRAVNTDKDTGTDTDGTTGYSFTLEDLRVIPNTVEIFIPDNSGGTITVTDDGSGALAESGGNGTGTINYTNGSVSISGLDSATPSSGDNITVTHAYEEVRAQVSPASDESPEDLFSLLDIAVLKNELDGQVMKSGTETLSSGGTTVSVSFSNDFPDASYVVLLTAAEAMGSASAEWTTSKSASGFTINVDADPTQDVDFDWVALRLS